MLCCDLYGHELVRINSFEISEILDYNFNIVYFSFLELMMKALAFEIYFLKKK